MAADGSLSPHATQIASARYMSSHLSHRGDLARAYAERG